MEMIVVAGKASGVGKTTLIKGMIKNLGCRTGVIKTSLKKDIKERLVTDGPEFISETGKDTAILKEAGAEKVVFLRTDLDNLEVDLKQARGLIGRVDYLILEGNSILDYLDPDLIIYLTSDDLIAKPSATKARARADLIIDHSKEGFTFNIDHISCSKAHLIARALGYRPIEIGKRLIKEDIKIKKCQLGLF